MNPCNIQNQIISETSSICTDVSLVIHRVLFNNCKKLSGGGGCIYLSLPSSGVEIRITQVQFQNGSTPGDGGGGYWFAAHFTFLMDSTCFDNCFGSGDPAFRLDSSTSTITKANFSLVACVRSYGGAFAWTSFPRGGSSTIKVINLSHTDSKNNGPCFDHGFCTSSIIFSTFEKNVKQGKTVQLRSGHSEVRKCNFEANEGEQAMTTDGDAIVKESVFRKMSLVFSGSITWVDNKFDVDSQAGIDQNQNVFQWKGGTLKLVKAYVEESKCHIFIQQYTGKKKWHKRTLLSSLIFVLLLFT